MDTMISVEFTKSLERSTSILLPAFGSKPLKWTDMTNSNRIHKSGYMLKYMKREKVKLRVLLH